MTLATRCPACGTVFRVVQDQLRVCDGWVRCGRCSEAFNAQQAMLEWPAARAPAASGRAPGSSLAQEPLDRVPAPAVAAEVDQSPRPTVVGAEATLIDLPPGVEFVATDGALSPQSTPEAAQASGATDRVEPDFGFETVVDPAPAGTDAVPAEPAALAEPAATAAAPSSDAADQPASAAPPAPSFVLQAERAARWRRPGVRLALGLASLLAALGLAAQVAYGFRDRIAAASPAARPLLQQACAAIGCRIGEYRRIDALSMESSALVRVEGAPVYRLAVTLRNRAAVEVAAPALDLVLTDAQGRPIARRVLQMSDLDLPLRSLEPGSELPIQVPLGISGPVSGYTVEIFYP